VSDWIREHADMRSTVASLADVYREVIGENVNFVPDIEADGAYLSRFASSWTAPAWERYFLREEVAALQGLQPKIAQLELEKKALQEFADYHLALAHQREHELQSLRASRSVRIAQALRRFPLVGWAMAVTSGRRHRVTTP
jgi:hypothetical protein